MRPIPTVLSICGAMGLSFQIKLKVHSVIKFLIIRMLKLMIIPGSVIMLSMMRVLYLGCLKTTVILRNIFTPSLLFTEDLRNKAIYRDCKNSGPLYGPLFFLLVGPGVRQGIKGSWENGEKSLWVIWWFNSCFILLEQIIRKASLTLL